MPMMFKPVTNKRVYSDAEKQAIRDWIKLSGDKSIKQLTVLVNKVSLIKRTESALKRTLQNWGYSTKGL